ncbi:hypothetical protein [Sphingobacterium sp. LRF_L2]|uniref:hypothetical protein n=1 Tax=Sphingobacterium sp. LRF_L2 TaxID=3369421 RepID=UPI003F61E85A
MKHLILMVCAAAIFSCSKKDESLKNPIDYTLKIEKGHGGVFVGANRSNSNFTVTFTNKATGFAQSTAVMGFSDLKYTPNCQYTDKRIMAISLPAGDYTVKVENNIHTEAPWGWDITVEEGKCMGVNAFGTAW